MSDQPEDQNGIAAEVTAPQAGAWPEVEERPAWESIADQAEPAAPGLAGPGASPQGEAPEQAPGEAEAATEAGRSRRPTSLRDQYVQKSPVSEATEPGNSGEVPHKPRLHVPHPSSVNVPSPAALLGKLPTDKLPRDKISKDKLPVDKLSADRLPVAKLRTLTGQRPEVGLGLAFAGGLVIATILKRLGRR